jgi:hypothetical protein
VGCTDVVAVAFPVFAVVPMNPPGGRPSSSESSAPGYGVINSRSLLSSSSLLDLEEEEEREPRPVDFSPAGAGT